MTEYEKKGLVEVEFRTNVTYQKPHVAVKDSTGKSYKAVIIERDEDDLTFRVKKYQTGKKYTYEISGVCAAGETAFRTVKGSFRIPKKPAKPVIEETRTFFAIRRSVELSAANFL